MELWHPTTRGQNSYLVPIPLAGHEGQAVRRGRDEAGAGGWPLHQRDPSAAVGTSGSGIISWGPSGVLRGRLFAAGAYVGRASPLSVGGQLRLHATARCALFCLRLLSGKAPCLLGGWLLSASEQASQEHHGIPSLRPNSARAPQQRPPLQPEAPMRAGPPRTGGGSRAT